jgi:transketolase
MTGSPAGRDRLAINAIRILAIDAVEQARSGHPGMPMGAADYAYLLWTRHLRFDPSAPDWPDRDRFVLSAGHGSMLLYALLHLCGFDLTLDDLKRFRQYGSRTAGHPEHGFAPGIETTTGPLGQGVGNAVGMAIAARMMADRFNTKEFAVVGHRVWAIVSDGDLMEGVASEAASLAGHLRLGNLTLIYDDNRITIEGETRLAFSEDVGRRFEAYGFEVQRIDGHDHAAIASALDAAARQTARPGLIVARTHIAHGSPGKHDSAEAHGAPLGPEEAAATKKNLGWPDGPPFQIPDEARAPFRERAEAGKKLRAAWSRVFDAWSAAHPDRRRAWDALVSRAVPDDILGRLLEALPAGAKPEATRVTSSRLLQAAAALVPSLCGGSADLEPSTKTRIKESASISSESFAGRNFHFGIREHGMGAVLNGISLSGSFIPYGSTFLIFSDYMRPAIRLAALMKRQVIYVFTHDSIFLGEDGPTHQPIEQLAALRAIPNLVVVRPADPPETAMAWALALRRREGPTAFALTRQNVPPLERPARFDPAVMLRGGYLLAGDDADRDPVVMVASGSEVSCAVEARSLLRARGIAARVVSMPCPQIFLEQPEEYRRGVIPDPARVVVIEAASTQGWDRIAGSRRLLLGIERFGASAPAEVLAEKFGFTGPQVADRVLRFLGTD